MPTSFARALCLLGLVAALFMPISAPAADDRCDFSYVGDQVLRDAGWIDQTDEASATKWARKALPTTRAVLSDEEWTHFVIIGWDKSPVDFSALSGSALRRWFEVQAGWFGRGGRANGADANDGVLDSDPVTFTVSRTFQHQRGTYTNAYYGIAATANCVLYVVLSGPSESEDYQGWRNGEEAVSLIRSAVLKREGPLALAAAGRQVDGGALPPLEQIAIAAIAFGLFMLLLFSTVELHPGEQIAGYCRYMIGLYCLYAVIAWINGEIGIHIQGITSANGLAIISIVAAVHAVALFTASPLMTLAGAAVVLAHASLVVVMFAYGWIDATWTALLWAAARVGIVAHLLFTAARLKLAFNG